MKKQVLTLVGVLSLLLAAGSAYAQSIHAQAGDRQDRGHLQAYVALLSRWER